MICCRLQYNTLKLVAISNLTLKLDVIAILNDGKYLEGKKEIYQLHFEKIIKHLD